MISTELLSHMRPRRALLREQLGEKRNRTPSTKRAASHHLFKNGPQTLGGNVEMQTPRARLQGPGLSLREPQEPASGKQPSAACSLLATLWMNAHLGSGTFCLWGSAAETLLSSVQLFGDRPPLFLGPLSEGHCWGQSPSQPVTFTAMGPNAPRWDWPWAALKSSHSLLDKTLQVNSQAKALPCIVDPVRPRGRGQRSGAVNLMEVLVGRQDRPNTPAPPHRGRVGG